VEDAKQAFSVVLDLLHKLLVQQENTVRKITFLLPQMTVSKDTIVLEERTKKDHLMMPHILEMYAQKEVTVSLVSLQTLNANLVLTNQTRVQLLTLNA